MSRSSELRVACMRIAMVARGFASVLVALSFLWGCASLFGGTSVFTLPLDPWLLSGRTASLQLASLEMEPGACRLPDEGERSVGFFGDFSPHDVENLRQSLQTTLGPAAPKAQAEGGLSLYVVVRSYIVVGLDDRNTRVLACTAWCLADPSGNIVYDEQFFASNRTGSMTPIGSCKMAVNRKIVERIATRAVYATQPSPPAVEPIFEGTFNDFGNAARPLDLPGSAFVPTGKFKQETKYYGSYSATTTTSEGKYVPLDWNRVERQGLINWKDYIATRRSRN